MHLRMDRDAPDFDWNQVRAFLATVRAGSLSAAAKQLGLTQPTLGRQVAGLERDLGVTLFERVGRSLVLTEAGRELAEHVEGMGEAATRISLAAASQSQSVEGLVRIAASDIFAVYVLPPILERLQREAPGIVIEIVASNDVSDLLRREADIAIRHLRPAQDDVIARRCTDTSAALVATTAYLDRLKHPRTGAKLAAAADFIGFSDRNGDLIAELNRRGVPVTAASFRFLANSGLVAWQLIRQGLGVGVMMQPAIDAAPDMRPALTSFVPIPIPIWLAAHRELRTSRRVRLVYDLLAGAL